MRRLRDELIAQDHIEDVLMEARSRDIPREDYYPHGYQEPMDESEMN